jgi:signal transduction histidine kinase
MKTINRLVSFFSGYQDHPPVGANQSRNQRLLVFSILMGLAVFGMFSVLSLLSLYYYNAAINIIGSIAMGTLLYFHRKGTEDTLSAYAFIFVCYLIISTQHLISPIALSANILWACPLVVIAVYFVGASRGMVVTLLGAVLISLAEFLKSRQLVATLDMSESGIYLYQYGSLILSLLLTWYFAKQSATEEQSAIGRLEIRTEQLTQQKDETMYLVSLLCHDIANPLTVVSGLTELSLASGTDRVTIKNNLKKSMEQVDLMSNLIDQVRFFRMDQKNMFTMPLEAVDLTKFVEESIEQQKPLLSRKEVTVVKNYDPQKQVFVTAEPKTLRRSVMMGLFSEINRVAPLNARVGISIIRSEDQVCLEAEIADQLSGAVSGPHHAAATEGARSNNDSPTRSGAAVVLPLVSLIMNKYGGELTSSKSKSPSGSGSTTRLLLSFSAPPES